ncbi:MAG TPA: peptidase U32 family protein [Cerasibacillus sp.]|uniref:peptidase U32 family protein n=1 Tax=Cerasibacillus sp. TaxID=2498711 RepID=UPI002F3FE285
MFELVATAESIEQAEQLLDAGIDTLYIGEEAFGLRLPASFSVEDIAHITDLAHAKGKKVCVAVNAIMHNDRIKTVIPYLNELEKIKVDKITVGDPGVIHLMKKNDIKIPYIYDAQTMVTSANQINFWVKRGAQGAVLARELPYEELTEIREQVTVPLEVLVYGATCIHQSLRPLVQNYVNFTKQDTKTGKETGLFISEKKDPETHYSVYEDINGTHIFATDDVNLMPYLNQLVDAGLTTWKLDGIFTKGDSFVEIAKLFVHAKEAFTNKEWSNDLMNTLQEKLESLHPEERSMAAGFYTMDPSDVN